MSFPIVDFPKIQSPFVRETINGRYVVTPQITPGYEWVFEDPAVKAVDKLHGTNICLLFKNGILSQLTNRENLLMSNPFIGLYTPKNAARAMSGAIAGIERRWLPEIENGPIFGELIAPDINGNIHGTDRPLFVPFEHLRDRCFWTSWSKNKYPKTFEAISEWFKEIPSLFSQKYLKKNCLAEGLVFTHKDGRMAKLRRDMFDWYEGEDHNKGT